MYRPVVASIAPPPFSWTVHVTAGEMVPVTAAANCCTPLGCSDVVDGVIVTVGPCDAGPSPASLEIPLHADSALAARTATMARVIPPCIRIILWLLGEGEAVRLVPRHVSPDRGTMEHTLSARVKPP